MDIDYRMRMGNGAARGDAGVKQSDSQRVAGGSALAFGHGFGGLFTCCPCAVFAFALFLFGVVATRVASQHSVGTLAGRRAPLAGFNSRSVKTGRKRKLLTDGL
jgi:hypothetical protein